MFHSYTSIYRTVLHTNRLLTLWNTYTLKSQMKFFPSTWWQTPDESVDEFLRELHKLSKNCVFKTVTARWCREELVRDTFLNELSSSIIRQRLLENCTLDLQSANRQASSFDLDYKNSEAYNNMTTSHIATTTSNTTDITEEQHYDIVSCPLVTSFWRKKSLPVSNKKRFLWWTTLQKEYVSS